MTNLDYARAILETQGPSAPVTWLTVSELIELLEDQETVVPANQDRVKVIGQERSK